MAFYFEEIRLPEYQAIMLRTVLFYCQYVLSDSVNCRAKQGHPFAWLWLDLLNILNLTSKRAKYMITRIKLFFHFLRNSNDTAMTYFNTVCPLELSSCEDF